MIIDYMRIYNLAMRFGEAVWFTHTAETGAAYYKVTNLCGSHNALIVVRRPNW